MPVHRDTSITRQCAWCGQPFHPWAHKPTTMYCSALCARRAALAGINGGVIDPTPMPVRQSNSDRTLPALSVNVNAPGHCSAEELGATWRQAGEHWERVAAWYAARRAAEHQRAQRRDFDMPSLSVEGRVITLTGYSARLHVERGALHVQHGRTYSTQEPAEEVLYRGTHGVSQITWLTNGGAGVLSLESIKWLRSQRITLCILGGRGEHIVTVHPDPDAPQALGYPAQENGRGDAKLQRAQYSLLPSGQDVPLARQIILRKLAGQRRCLDRHQELPDRNRAYSAVDMAIEWLSLDPPTPATSTLAGIRLYEARASRGYFSAWVGLPLLSDAQADRHWPPAWQAMEGRMSPLTRWESPRRATNPGQALVNLAYSMLSR